jgi:NDP-sugar pyrophosphorylase family protein
MSGLKEVIGGVTLAGTYAWSRSAFDLLVLRPLVPVAHRPLISYGLSWFLDAGIGNVTVCGNRNTRGLEAHLARHVPARMTLTYLEDPMPRGAAGCVHDAAAEDNRETFVVTDSTAVPTVDLPELLACHRASGAAATIVVCSEPRDSGSPRSPIPVGIYVFERRALESIPQRGYFDIKEHLIPFLYRAGERVQTYHTTGTVPRVLSAQTYLAVSELVTERVVSHAEAPEGYRRRGDALIHAEASVAPDAILAGPILVEAGASILPKAVVIGPTSIGRDVRIEASALVSRSAVWRRSTVEAGGSVDRCILGDDAVVRANGQECQTVVTASPHGGGSERYAGRGVSARPQYAEFHLTPGRPVPVSSRHGLPAAR